MIFDYFFDAGVFYACSTLCYRLGIVIACVNLRVDLNEWKWAVYEFNYCLRCDDD